MITVSGEQLFTLDSGSGTHTVRIEYVSGGVFNLQSLQVLEDIGLTATSSMFARSEAMILIGGITVNLQAGTAVASLVSGAQVSVAQGLSATARAADTVSAVERVQVPLHASNSSHLEHVGGSFFLDTDVRFIASAAIASSLGASMDLSTGLAASLMASAGSPSCELVVPTQSVFRSTVAMFLGISSPLVVAGLNVFVAATNAITSAGSAASSHALSMAQAILGAASSSAGSTSDLSVLSPISALAVDSLAAEAHIDLSVDIKCEATTSAVLTPSLEVPEISVGFSATAQARSNSSVALFVPVYIGLVAGLAARASSSAGLAALMAQIVATLSAALRIFSTLSLGKSTSGKQPPRHGRATYIIGDPVPKTVRNAGVIIIEEE